MGRDGGGDPARVGNGFRRGDDISAASSGGYRRESGAAADEEAVEEKEDHGSDDGYGEATQVEPEELWTAGNEFVGKPPTKAPATPSRAW